MFLVDKYFNDSNHYILHNSIIEKILDSFDTHNEIYSKIQDVVKKPDHSGCKFIGLIGNKHVHSL